ncbi:hypothetical protein [Thalassotalea sp. PS06]|uniref:hypothetical protein n=1 Tax=Thalassotalea sp. PS06 TaxID=2594005 RepID=UPI001165B072|nr:hypothetical protein [Thalassotalea sp. PS06]QDP01450.1 hypothetical protein FNC98_08975 [Thalassotalea sp. PS06]
MNVRAVLPVLTGLLLLGCNDGNDSESIDSISFSSMALSECVSQSASYNDYEKIGEVEVLSCRSTDSGLLDQNALEEMSQFYNLKTLHLGYMGSQVDFDGSLFPNLQTFRCDDCGIQTMDLSQNPELTSFEIWTNRYLNELDFSHNPNLTKLNLAGVSIIDLDLGSQEFLQEAYLVGRNPYRDLRFLDFSEATALEKLDMLFIGADYLDLSNNKALSWLDIRNSNLESIVIGSQVLQRYAVMDSYLYSVDVEAFPELRSLVLYGNQIGYINLDQNPNLELVNLEKNPLSTEMLSYLQSISWVDRIVY